MKINFAIVCYKMRDERNAEVKHICCYETEPGQFEADALRQELASDPEFNMTDDQDYHMTLIRRPENEDTFKELGIPEEIDNQEQNG